MKSDGSSSWCLSCSIRFHSSGSLWIIVNSSSTMSLRVRRKFTSSTFDVDGQLCKIFLQPWFQQANGFWGWNVGFAIGKSRRQLNDWYWQRKNRRRRSLKGKLVGRSGLKAIRKGFEEVQRLRWSIPAGDTIVLDCTSADPDRQFHAWSRWSTKYPDFLPDPIKKEFYWTRPPYPEDEVWQHCHVIPVVPTELRKSTVDQHYFACFRIRLKHPDNPPSSDRITGLLDPAQASE